MSWSDLATALALVAVIEGLALALLPKRLDDMLEVLRAMPLETRRTLGLGLAAFGVALLWVML
ncbi:MAG: DUF2065 family protein [Pseudomonadota bacterium]